MNRKDFIKKSLATGLLTLVEPGFLKATEKFNKSNEKIGFNQLPNKEEKTMNTVLHKAATRGHANHGWLDTHHTFSFANYYNPDRMHFGVLRVLNDDLVSAGKGFDIHPHDNMEIVSIPLKGELKHKDSMGNTAIIKTGDIQVMSAGTGVFHSEYNNSTHEDLAFLQIWVFPNKKQVEPRYDQIDINSIKKDNQFFQILSPFKEDQGVWMHQNAWFSLGEFTINKSTTYKLNDTSNGVYLFVLEGEITIGDHILNKRDGIGIWDIDHFTIDVLAGSKVVVMEVPMH